METYRRQAYVWISVALAMPVLLWPVLLVTASPEAYMAVTENWLLAAASLLLAAVVADSVLEGAAHARVVLVGAIWVLLVSALIPFINHDPRAGWLLAVLFALHALRSAVPLWQQREQWWHWYAWLRDGAMALVMFYWLTHWPV